MGLDEHREAVIRPLRAHECRSARLVPLRRSTGLSGKKRWFRTSHALAPLRTDGSSVPPFARSFPECECERQLLREDCSVFELVTRLFEHANRAAYRKAPHVVGMAEHATATGGIEVEEYEHSPPIPHSSRCIRPKCHTLAAARVRTWCSACRRPAVINVARFYCTGEATLAQTSLVVP